MCIWVYAHMCMCMCIYVYIIVHLEFEDRIRTWLSEDDDETVASDISIVDNSKHPEKPLLQPREVLQPRVTLDESNVKDMTK